MPAIETPPPVILCRHCLCAIETHESGACETTSETFSFLPLGDVRPIRDVADSWGDALYLFWVADCWDPATYTARGQSFQDAYEWFLDYAAPRGILGDEILPETYPEECAMLAAGESVSGTDYVDGYGYFWTESVGGRHLAGPDRG
jgi:hypothetical protein